MLQGGDLSDSLGDVDIKTSRLGERVRKQHGFVDRASAVDRVDRIQDWYLETSRVLNDSLHDVYIALPVTSCGRVIGRGDNRSDSFVLKSLYQSSHVKYALVKRSERLAEIVLIIVAFDLGHLAAFVLDCHSRVQIVDIDAFDLDR